MRFANFLCAAVLAMPFGESAQTGPASLNMLTGWWTDGGTHIAAFEITLDEDWKTYWRSPGDAGIPPQVNWAKSRNLANATLRWPQPKIFDEEGGRTIGYKDRLVLPVELKPTAMGKPLVAAGQIDLGICLDICLPISFRFYIEIPSNGSPNAEITTALATVPTPRQGSQIPGLACSVEPLSDGLRVTARMSAPSQRASMAAVFEHKDREIWISGTDMSRANGKLSIAADFVGPEAQPFALDRSQIRLTLFGRSEAIEILGCPAG